MLWVNRHPLHEYSLSTYWVPGLVWVTGGHTLRPDSRPQEAPNLMRDAHNPLQHSRHGGPEKASTLMKAQFELDFPESSAG